MSTYLIRINGQTLFRVTADSAEEALETAGFRMTELNDQIVVVISTNGLDFISYGTTYAFDADHKAVAVRGI